MTQLTFDFSCELDAQPSASRANPCSVGPTNRIAQHLKQIDDAEPKRFPHRQVSGKRDHQSANSGSLPLYDPQRGELHHMGDLAQQVLARYDIVHARRRARLAREAARRQQAVS